MEFPKQVLQDMCWGDCAEPYKIIYDEITDNSRWSVHHEMVFKFEDKFFKTHYSVGATEYQDESPYEYEGDMVECKEVFPTEVTKTVYK